MNSAKSQDGGTRPAGRSKIPLLHKPGSTLLQALLTTPLVPDSGLWTAVHLLCGGKSKLGKYDICTKCCWAAGVSSGHSPPLPGAQSLPGGQVRPQGLWECPAACPGTQARRVWRRGRGCYFKQHCGCLTNRCGRRFSFHGQWCSQRPAAWAPWTAPQG